MAAGSTLEECDQYPLYLCPECLAKLHWSIRPNAVDRFTRLAEFCRLHALTDEQYYYEQAAQRIGKQQFTNEPAAGTL
jgi:archaemetzincin